MFANDVLLHKPVKTHGDFLAFQNGVVSQLSQVNHLILNTSKTKFMRISHSKLYSWSPHILLDGIQLEQVSHYIIST